MKQAISKFQKAVNSTFFGFGGILLALNSLVFPQSMRYFAVPDRPAEVQSIIAQAAEPPAEETPKPEPKRVIWVLVTAYSSTPDQTDDTPFYTANGTHVYDGIVAANFLKFGTKVRFPDYFGDKEFSVEDRMNARFPDRMDIWFPTREAAMAFGLRKLKVEIY
jgi:3D (Asp-Asp-Asp) domain-containing protein